MNILFELPGKEPVKMRQVKGRVFSVKLNGAEQYGNTIVIGQPVVSLTVNIQGEEITIPDPTPEFVNAVVKAFLDKTEI